MFPLSCARVHTGRETSEQEKTCSTMFPPKMFFAHISYTSFKIQMSSGKRNFLHTQTLKN